MIAMPGSEVVVWVSLAPLKELHQPCSAATAGIQVFHIGLCIFIIIAMFTQV